MLSCLGLAPPHPATTAQRLPACLDSSPGWTAARRLQVSSLVSLRLLEQCGGDALEGQLYRCNLGEGMAKALGDNVRVQLTDYLRLG